MQRNLSRSVDKYNLWEGKENFLNVFIHAMVLISDLSKKYLMENKTKFISLYKKKTSDM